MDAVGSERAAMLGVSVGGRMAALFAARTCASVAFEDRGEHALKGIVEPHRLFAVRTDA